MWAFAVGALNPVLLIHTSEVLAICSRPCSSSSRWRCAGSCRTGSDARLTPAASAFLSFLCAGAAVAVRPANAVVAAALVVDLAGAGPPVAGALARGAAAGGARTAPAAASPAAAQLEAFRQGQSADRPQPLPPPDAVGDGSAQVRHGRDSGALAVSGVRQPALPGRPDAGVLLPAPPPRTTLATLALHGFAMLDYDYPFTFITSLRLWYRLAAGGRQLRASRSWPSRAACSRPSGCCAQTAGSTRRAFAQWSTILVVGAYLALYARSRSRTASA